MALFVDDLLISSDSPDYVNMVKEHLYKKFPIKELGPFQQYLDISITRGKKSGTIELDQRDYAMHILRNFRMHGCKGVLIPLESGTVLSPSAPIQTISEIPYQNAVGALLYLFQARRPNLGFSISAISKFRNHYDETYWTAVKRVMRYLQKIKD